MRPIPSFQTRAIFPLVLALACLSACAVEETASGPLPQEAYVWQRAWGPAVTAAVAETAPGAADGDLSGLVLLAAEVKATGEGSRGTDGGRSVHRVAYDAGAVPSGRAGLAVRINPLPGGRDLDDAGPIASGLLDLVVGEVARARAAGLAVTELQLDYDCPTRGLAAYARFVDTTRARLAAAFPEDAPPVTWTALPDWLRSDDFPRLLDTLGPASPGYVLQVHSLELPQPGHPAPLVDPAAARRAVARAARFGRPFRVALPTYGYEARFTAGGELMGLAAEGAAPRRPDERAARVTSDAHALADLVASWERQRPAELVGLAWFRLPTGRDARAWSPEVFRAARAGRVVEAPPVTARARRAAPELLEIDLTAPAAGGAAPAAVRVTWSGAHLTAADGLGGYRAAPVVARAGGPRREIRFETPRLADAEPLRPGERRPVAWLRFDRPIDPTEVELELVD